MTGSRDHDFHRGKRPAPQRPGTREGLQLPITLAIQPPSLVPLPASLSVQSHPLPNRKPSFEVTKFWPIDVAIDVDMNTAICVATFPPSGSGFETTFITGG